MEVHVVPLCNDFGHSGSFGWQDLILIVINNNNNSFVV